MPIEILGTLEDVNTYTGKNGFGANVTMSVLVGKTRKSITFNTNDAEHASILSKHLQDAVCVTIALDQNNFGLRLGNILNINFDIKKVA